MASKENQEVLDRMKMDICKGCEYVNNKRPCICGWQDEFDTLQKAIDDLEYYKNELNKERYVSIYRK